MYFIDSIQPIPVLFFVNLKIPKSCSYHSWADYTAQALNSHFQKLFYKLA